jgi:hypothetical protein
VQHVIVFSNLIDSRTISDAGIAYPYIYLHQCLNLYCVVLWGGYEGKVRCTLGRLIKCGLYCCFGDSVATQSKDTM